jgi:ribosome biogenesis GTPase A
VGNRPGVTTSVHWLKTNYNILLLDTPGILWPKFDEEKVALNLAATGAIKSEILNADEIAVYVLEYLNDNYPNLLKERYNVDTFSDVLEAYETIGKKIGAYKNGEVDYEKVSIKILNDIKGEYLKGVTFDDR